MQGSRCFRIIFILLAAEPACFGSPSSDHNGPPIIQPICGDGRVDPNEECDDGAQNSKHRSQGCRANCTLARCGDGILDSGEACDAGPLNSDFAVDGCRSSCILARCGDGVADSGEECDTGAGRSDTVADACRRDCSVARCGDGVVDTGESCDDGAIVPGDGCNEQCILELDPVLSLMEITEVTERAAEFVVRLDGWGHPSITELGVCVGRYPDPGSSTTQAQCARVSLDAGQPPESDPPSTRISVADLKPATSYDARAFAVTGAHVTYETESLSFATVPSAPKELRVVGGVDRVDLEWEAVAPDAVYWVYRDGIAIAGPLAQIRYSDFDTSSWVVEGPESLSSRWVAASGSIPGYLMIDWEHSRYSPDPLRYSVRSANAWGTSSGEAVASGHRADPTVGYELRINGEGPWIPIALDSLQFYDRQLQNQKVDAGIAYASEIYSDSVNLEVERTKIVWAEYEVRPLIDARSDVTEQWTTTTGRYVWLQREEDGPRLSYQWLRVRGVNDDPQAYEIIPGATEKWFEDTDAPSDGGKWRYKCRVCFDEGPGVGPCGETDSVLGWRDHSPEGLF